MRLAMSSATPRNRTEDLSRDGANLRPFAALSNCGEAGVTMLSFQQDVPKPPEQCLHRRQNEGGTGGKQQRAAEKDVGIQRFFRGSLGKGNLCAVVVCDPATTRFACRATHG